MLQEDSVTATRVAPFFSYTAKPTHYYIYFCEKRYNYPHQKEMTIDMFRNLTVADLFILVNKLNTHTICIDFFSPWPALVGLSILMVEVSR